VPVTLLREKEGAELKEGDPWASREFHIKWKRYSFIHTSWETRETLSKLGGYKRITNYIKRQEKEKVQLPLA
jgi:chromodomain-helicase-DNA-binding protein 1